MNRSKANRVFRALRSLPAACAVGLVAACAGSSAGDGGGGSLPADCIINRGVRDYDLLDNRNLIIYGAGGNAYHVVMATPATTDLRGELGIGILDDDGRICPYGRDAIIIDGPITERIPIRSIERLDDADVEALQIEYGLIEPAGDAVTVTEIE